MDSEFKKIKEKIERRLGKNFIEKLEEAANTSLKIEKDMNNLDRIEESDFEKFNRICSEINDSIDNLSKKKNEENDDKKLDDEDCLNILIKCTSSKFTDTCETCPLCKYNDTGKCIEILLNNCKDVMKKLMSE